jgi:hypothetical protein
MKLAKLEVDSFSVSELVRLLLLPGSLDNPSFTRQVDHSPCAVVNPCVFHEVLLFDRAGVLHVGPDRTLVDHAVHFLVHARSIFWFTHG